ncbi:MAG: O-antigen ligase family protein [Tissierellia bacterium]|nr:O-antigen ligase family protein [Tissierellia bacterium]
MNFLKDYSFREKLIFITSISILFPFYISGAILIFDFIYIIMSEDFRDLNEDLTKYKCLSIFIFYSVFVSIVFNNFYGILATMAMGVIYIFFVFFRRYYNPKLFEITISAMLTISSFWFLNTALYGLNIYMNTESLNEFLKFVSVHRSDSVFFNPNYYGMVAGFMFLIGLNRLISSENKKEKMIYIAYLLLAAIAVFFSGSRGAQIALVFGAAYLSLKSNKRSTTFLLFAAMSIFLIIILKTGNIHSTRIATIKDDVVLRKAIWQKAISAIEQNFIIGAGPMGIHALYNTISSRLIIHSHNLILDFLVNYGLIGILLITPVIMSLVSEIRRVKNTEIYNIIVSMTIFVVIHGMMDVTIFWHQTAYIYFIFISSANKFQDKVEVGDMIRIPYGPIGAHSFKINY